MMRVSAAQRLGRPTFVMLWASVTVIVQLLNYGAISVIGRQSIWDSLDAAGQVLVLSTVAISWKWWWAGATIAGGAARDFAIINFFPADNAWFVLPVVYFISSAPHWFVLRRYGNRSYAWLAVPLVTSQAGTLIYSIARAQGISASPAQGGLGWLGPAAASGVVFGIVEAAALVWILEREFSPASTLPAKDVVRTPGPREALDVTSQLVWVRMGLVFALLLAIPLAVPELFVQTHNTPQFVTLAAALLYLAPWMVALGLLAWTRFRYAGFAFAASASIVLLVPLVPVVAAVLLMPESMFVNSRAQEVSYVSTVALAVLSIVIVIQAIRGALRIHRSERSPWAWPAGFLGTIACGFAVFAVSQAVDRQAVVQFGEASQNETFAVGNVDTIWRCAHENASKSRARGFPRSLKEMSVGDTGCVDRLLAGGEFSGYRYHYYAAPPDPDGVVRAFVACAEPIRFGRTGSMTVASNEKGPIPQLYSGNEQDISCTEIVSTQNK